MSAADPFAGGLTATKHTEERKVARYKRGNKFNVAAPDARTWAGLKFASKHEMQVALALLAALPATDYTIFGQTHYEILPRQNDAQGKLLFRALRFSPDFLIVKSGPEQEARPQLIVEAKGMETADYKLRVAMFYRRFHQRVHVVTSVKQLGQVPWQDLGVVSIDLEVFSNPRYRKIKIEELDHDNTNRLIKPADTIRRGTHNCPSCGFGLKH